MEKYLKKVGLAVVLMAAAASMGSGCAYLANRGNDAMDMIDIGVTVSAEPGFAFFYDFVPVIPIGAGYVNGYFIGLGGGKFSIGYPHYQRSIGLVLWGEEEVTFEHSEDELLQMTPEQRWKATNFQRTGLAGLAQGPPPDTDYLISCPHYLHLGFIGLVGSPRYLQMLDFVLGWTTLDIGMDDHRWEQESESTAALAPAQEDGTPEVVAKTR